MTTFIALYRGETIASARLIAVSADPDVVAYVTECLLAKEPASGGDAVLAEMEHGKRAALRIVLRESKGDH